MKTALGLANSTAISRFSRRGTCLEARLGRNCGQFELPDLAKAVCCSWISERREGLKSFEKSSEENLFIAMWGSPRQLIREAMGRRSIAVFFLLAAIGGIWKCLFKVVRDEVPLAETYNVGTIVAINIGFGAVYGIFICCTTAILVCGVARLFGTQVSTREMFIIKSCSSAPLILPLAALLTLIALTGDLLVSGSIRDPNNLPCIALVGLMICCLLLIASGVWSISILVVGLSEVGKIGIGRSIFIYSLTGIAGFTIVTISSIFLTRVFMS